MAIRQNFSVVLRRFLSMIKMVSTRLMSGCRVTLCRVMSRSVDVPFSTSIGKGVRVHVTDGGVLNLGEQVYIGANSQITVRAGHCSLARSVELGPGCIIACQERVVIEEGTLIAEYVTIRDQDHNFEGGVLKSEAGFKTAPIVIGSNVWLGAKVTITKGVSIGKNSVIGANSVVTCDIPENVVAVGVPARVVRNTECDSKSSHSLS